MVFLERLFESSRAVLTHLFERTVQQFLIHLLSRGLEADLATVTAEVRARDAADAARAAAPMKPAGDAKLLDTTELDPDQAFAAALALLAGTIAGAGKASGG